MRLLELQCKDVINVENGCRIGYVCDVDIDPQLAKICAIIVEQRSIINYLKFLKGAIRRYARRSILYLGNHSLHLPV